MKEPQNDVICVLFLSDHAILGEPLPVKPCLSLHWIFILVVCLFVAAGVAGTCAGQSLACPLLRRPQEARQSPIVPPQQQCV